MTSFVPFACCEEMDPWTRSTSAVLVVRTCATRACSQHREENITKKQKAELSVLLMTDTSGAEDSRLCFYQRFEKWTKRPTFISRQKPGMRAPGIPVRTRLGRIMPANRILGAGTTSYMFRRAVCVPWRTCAINVSLFPEKQKSTRGDHQPALNLSKSHEF